MANTAAPAEIRQHFGDFVTGQARHHEIGDDQVNGTGITGDQSEAASPSSASSTLAP